jgi:hypothetical protein
MEALRYDRLYRTPSSEAYLLSRDEMPVARLELHFTQASVFGLLLFEQEPADDELRATIARVDEDLVWTAGVPREDFVVSVYVGHELRTLDDAARERAEDGETTGGDDGR